MKTKFKKTLGIIALSTGLIGMSLPMSGYAHGHHRHWWRHHGGAVLAATMVGMAVGAVAAGNSGYYNQSNCHVETYRPAHFNRWGNWVHRRWVEIDRCN